MPTYAQVAASARAELLKLRKRTAVLVLAGILVAILALLVYGLPYFFIKTPGVARTLPRGQSAESLLVVYLPRQFVGVAAENSGGLGGALALILGVLSIGSEYGWGTLKTILTQGPSRVSTYLGRVIALAAITAAFTLLAFATCALCAAGVGALEGKLGSWPDAGEIARGLLATWLLTSFWATFGMTLATLFRQSALAIGIGLVYSILFEGLVFTVLRAANFIENLEKFFPGANARALAQSFSVGVLPGQPPPLVGAAQATLVLGAYLVLLLAVSGTLLARRDVVG
jgi:ABC-type transport system involved in multi-copper enzyme maturation permease subunit